MTAKKAIEREIGRYLEEVAARLGEMPADEKDDVLRDIESHIYAALEKTGPTPSLDDLNVVLAGMDRPSSYAASVATTEPPQRRFSRCAIVATCFAPFAPAAYICVFGYVSEGAEGVIPALVRFVAWVVLLLGVVAPIATTALGLIAVSQIRASSRRLIGMPLAVAMTLLYPLLAYVVGMAFGIGHATRLIWGAGLSAPELHNLVTAGASFGGVMGILAAWFIGRAVWRWANRPLQSGEFT